MIQPRVSGWVDPQVSMAQRSKEPDELGCAGNNAGPAPQKMYPLPRMIRIMGKPPLVLYRALEPIRCSACKSRIKYWQRFTSTTDRKALAIDRALCLHCRPPRYPAPPALAVLADSLPSGGAEYSIPRSTDDDPAKAAYMLERSRERAASPYCRLYPFVL